MTTENPHKIKTSTEEIQSCLCICDIINNLEKHEHTHTQFGFIELELGKQKHPHTT